MLKQRTLKTAIKTTGVGLHTGARVELNEAVCEAHPYTGKDLHLQMMQTPLMP